MQRPCDERKLGIQRKNQAVSNFKILSTRACQIFQIFGHLMTKVPFICSENKKHKLLDEQFGKKLSWPSDTIVYEETACGCSYTAVTEYQDNFQQGYIKKSEVLDIYFLPRNPNTFE